MLVFLVICCTLSYRFCKVFGPRLLILYFPLFFAVIVLVNQEVKGRIRNCTRVFSTKSFVFKLREIVQPTLQHSPLIRLLRSEISFNAGVFFFFLLAVHANNPFSLSQRDVCAAGCCYGLLNYGLFFLFYLQGLINMKLYDKLLYANLEDLTV